MPLRAWQRMLILAQHYGWEPQGTEPPDDVARDCGIWSGDRSQWDGRYFASYGQHVVKSDAEALAAALEQALADIPDFDSLHDFPGGDPVQPWFNVTRPGVTLIEAFSGRNKQLLKGFIEHCREDDGLWMY
jgi:hypothetical protein